MLRKLMNQEGFTLIELMVVVLIIAILIAIAIPAFLGMRNRGYDAQAKSSLRNGVTAAQTYYTDTESFASMSAANLIAIESNISFSQKAGLAVGTDTANTVYIDTGSNGADAYRLSVLSTSGTVFSATKASGGGVAYSF